MNVIWKGSKGYVNNELVFVIKKPKGRISSDLYMGDNVINQHVDKEHLRDYATLMIN